MPQYKQEKMKSIVILASGRGSNAAQIIKHFAKVPAISVKAIISDRKASAALELAQDNSLEAHYIPYSAITDGELGARLHTLQPDLIVLAGFLRLIPSEVIKNYPEAIVNVHPSLLPRHGGPGMYGMRVHNAVIESADDTSGITIHYVNEEYDKGRIIAQFHCPVNPEDTPDMLAGRVLQLEHHHLPLVIHAILSL